MASSKPTPGLLYVTMQPTPELPIDEFHDWYNNEHGPTRLRLPFVTNGFRYRASDLTSTGTEEKPEWMALYDITDMHELTQETYLRLRGPPCKTPREATVMSKIKVDRMLFDLLSEWKSPDFIPAEDISEEGKERVIISIFLTAEDKAGEERLSNWYAEEHMGLISKVPGWLRTRTYATSSIDPSAPRKILTVHEYAPTNGLGGPEFKAATSTPRTSEIMTQVVKSISRRVYNLYYTFGPAPRYLSSTVSAWTSTDPTTPVTKVLFPSSSPLVQNGTIESYITTPHSPTTIHYTLLGSSSPQAPLILLSNSILTTPQIWTSFLTTFLTSPSSKNYRILLYSTRGRTSSPGPSPITIPLLSLDQISLLDALRIKTAACLIGVSLGGATVLHTALKYPSRISSFISCDTSSKSPSGNSKAWKERISLAESDHAISSSTGEKIVGEKLAEVTTRRWFVKESYEDSEIAPRLQQVKDMVINNSLEGFKKSVEALWEYDFVDMKVAGGQKGLFVVGGSDGVLPGTMKKMSEDYGVGYQVIEGAGHLPMVEKPVKFSGVVEKFLEG